MTVGQDRVFTFDHVFGAAAKQVPLFFCVHIYNYKHEHKYICIYFYIHPNQVHLLCFVRTSARIMCVFVCLFVCLFRNLFVYSLIYSFLDSCIHSLMPVGTGCTGIECSSM